MIITTPTLAGSLVTLRPILREDADSLVEAASDGELWNLLYTTVPSSETISEYLETAFRGETEGTTLPFSITLTENDKIIGSTRFWKVDHANRKLEIGHTWYSRSWQRTAANTEAKFLMLRYAFEQLACIRVQFTTDVLNERSQAAILRLGAVFEGVIRNERIMPDGRKRDSKRYSIIDDEWPTVCRILEQRLEHYAQKTEDAP